MPLAPSPDIDADDTLPSAQRVNARGRSRIILVCEHASNRIPARYAELGLTDTAKTSHAAWDPGALAVAGRLSKLLDAPLVHSTVSRLVYDCNRPPEAPDAMLAKSEQFAVPGNNGLSDADRAERITTVYEPFKELLADTIKSHTSAPILVTIHSFTRVYNGQHRNVDIGFIHDQRTDLATTIMRHADAYPDYSFALNEPYSKVDGVAHTLALHGTDNGLINVMVEVCNDRIKTSKEQDDVARILTEMLTASLADLNEDLFSEGAA